MENTLLNPLLSLIFLLSISCFVYIFAKKINFPYTVALVIVGLLLVPILQMGYLSFIRNFDLTPDMLFYIFLPVLIFESAYHINYKDLLRSGWSIFSLSVIGILISVGCIAVGMYYIFPLFGFHIPFLVCLLFGSLISATDTVAVLTLFKSVGAPKRLVTIFEGESLFNDGTALALFLVILGIIKEGSDVDWSVVGSGVAMFGSMFIGGILFGFFSGYVFSRIIGRIKNNEAVEITLTMVLAHLTFISAHVIGENLVWNGFAFHISGVIATTVAAIMMGNYGRYKISPKITEFMEKFWGFMAFIANSLVFILLGLIVSDVKIDIFSGFLYLVGIVFVLGIFSRAVSVFIPVGIINALKLEKKIPFKWQSVLAWGSPRGAISFMMILMIPDNISLKGWDLDFSIKDFLTLITISTIMLSLFLKVPSIGGLIKKLKLNKLNHLEKIEKEQSNIIVSLENIKKINGAYQKFSITREEYDILKSRFEHNISNSKEVIYSLTYNNHAILTRVISIISLGMIKKHLLELLTYNELDERNFKLILIKIQDKMRRLERREAMILNLRDDYEWNIFERVGIFLMRKKKSDQFIRNRALRICIGKVIEELSNMRKIDFGFDAKVYEAIIEIYSEQYKKLKIKKTEIKQDFIDIENMLFEHSITKTSEHTITDLKKKGIMTDKLYHISLEKLYAKHQEQGEIGI